MMESVEPPRERALPCLAGSTDDANTFVARLFLTLVSTEASPQPTDAVNYYYSSPDAPFASRRNQTRF